MNRRRSAWIRLLSLIVIIFTVAGLLRWLSSPGAYLTTRLGSEYPSFARVLDIVGLIFRVAYLTEAVGILLFKEWARKLFIITTITGYVFAVCSLYYFSKIADMSFIEVLSFLKVGVVLLTILTGVLLYVFTRASVKEQFG